MAPEDSNTDSNIDTKVLNKLADLSRLEFSPEALSQMGGDLENIVKFISKLSEVDTDNVAPTTSVLGLAEGKIMQTPEREDVVSEMEEDAVAKRDAFQEQAPEADMGFYVVPQVIE